MADSKHSVKASFIEQEVEPTKETPKIPPGNFEICVFCGKTFSNDNIKSHILKKHSEKVPKQRC